MNQAKPLGYRMLEILPGALVWSTFIFAFLFSFVRPLWVIIYIIIFDLYWVFRVFYFGIYLTASWRQYAKNVKINWLEKVRVLPRFLEMRHLIILPTYKESLELVRRGLDGLRQSNYPKDKMIVVLAGEERDKENFLEFAEIISREFGSAFGQLLITLHPANIPGEIAGKGSNAHWAGREARKLVNILDIPDDNVIVSIFDIDTLPHPEYFAYLTHTYLNTPQPTRFSYQPVAIYANNIWESPSVVRIAAFGTTFWLMTELARPERLFTFSSHSMSLRALAEVGFHDPQVVSEDSRIFLQCFMKYNGDYSVKPLYMPVFMNTVGTPRYFKSILDLYRQQRRWAYGAENIPYMIWEFSRNMKIPWRLKLKYAFNLIEGMYSWATAPILIFVLGRLPLYAAPPALRDFALVANTPFTLEFLMTLAMSGVFISAIFSLAFLPPRPRTMPKIKKLAIFLQWILLPVTFVIFGAFPAIDAQTRLMLGRYLGFWVTEKTR